MKYENYRNKMLVKNEIEPCYFAVPREMEKKVKKSSK